MTFWVIYILVQVSFFGGLLWGIVHCFLIFCRRSTMVANIFTQHPHHKKATYVPDLVGKVINY